jgi:hypothetical protein
VGPALFAVVVACAHHGGNSGGGTPFTVWVFDERLTMDGTDMPLAGVPVAFDPPGGGDRVLTNTDVDGHVTFLGDFSAGGASVTVFSLDHTFVTMLEASPSSAVARPNTAGKPPQDLVVYPPRLDSTTKMLTVELRGNIFGKHDPTNGQVALAASALPRLGSVETQDPTYAMRVPTCRPFFVLGSEFESALDKDGNVVNNNLFQSFRFDLPPRTDDELLDVDLTATKALPLQPVRIHAEAPRGQGSPFASGTRAYASVQSADSGITPGVFVLTTPSTDGLSFDIDVKLAETDISPERPITQAVLVAPDGSRTYRTEVGVASAGTSWTDFPMPPTVVNPDAARFITDAIPLDGFPQGADLVVQVLADGQLFWLLYGPPGGPKEPSFTLPRQDIAVDKDVKLYALSLAAKTDRVDLPVHGTIYRKMAVFRDIEVRKP